MSISRRQSSIVSLLERCSEKSDCDRLGDYMTNIILRLTILFISATINVLNTPKMVLTNDHSLFLLCKNYTYLLTVASFSYYWLCLFGLACCWGWNRLLTAIYVVRYVLLSRNRAIWDEWLLVQSCLRRLFTCIWALFSIAISLARSFRLFGIIISINGMTHLFLINNKDIFTFFLSFCDIMLFLI